MALSVKERMDLLEAFLTENGVLDSFQTNLNTSHADSDFNWQEYLITLCEVTDPILVFHGAFVFSETPEGFDYWNAICKKWVAKFKK